MHTSTTPLVYIADDGRTARYQGYQLGYQSTGRPDGTAESYLEFGSCCTPTLCGRRTAGKSGIW